MDEAEYVYLKLIYWLYQREDVSRARRFADRLEKLVRKIDSSRESIFGQEYRALICEARGDLAGAIRFREGQIRRIRKLHRLAANSPDWDYICRFYDHSDLSDRLDLLALLYDEAGDTRKAIGLLEESKEYCRRHGIPFEGQEVQDELQEDFQPAVIRNGKRERKT
jgi:hypothetical protein